MCMCAGLALERVALLATDLRINAYLVDGMAHRQDPGGKLAAFPGGFIAATGDGLLIMAALAAVRRTQPAGVEALQAVVADVYSSEVERIRAALPGAEPDRVRFLVVVRSEAGPQLLELDARGGVVQAGGDGFFIVSWPPELDDGDPRRTENRVNAPTTASRSRAALRAATNPPSWWWAAWPSLRDGWPPCSRSSG